ncbi:hypothetical protein SDRG_11490 [Saprolegnia diclina VS20]|uniref:Uncharacterized protein n=1 Tax=Saprolegnia diclina (strain VS20) TaxID=1156394 RepID=T0Q7X1_SAPDV|nr:hypothetical protein SDRG_11490 [Saprolegnia diclina VS20]EQC30731.1 hypothetical protein SDRG_11490 [Saprolegnia diclina VS20]|eukprot:XP_008615755.1 hypothetical protein SDRG_11490 [Saprolegnia diclina VS20]
MLELTRAKAAIKALGDGYATAVEALRGEIPLAQLRSDRETDVQVRDALSHYVPWDELSDDDLAPFVGADGACIVPADAIKLTVDTNNFHEMSRLLVGAFGSCVFTLSHLTLDGDDMAPRLSPLDTRDASWTLVIALDAPHSRKLTVTCKERSSTLELGADWVRESYAAWYVDCDVELAPISAGRRAYLVYAVQLVDAPTQRTAPPGPADTASMLSYLAAAPRQFATTYAYRCQDDAASFADLNAVHAELVHSFVAAGAFDVALVTLTDATAVPELSHQELQAVRDAVVQYILDNEEAIGEEARDALGYLNDELTYKVVNYYAGRSARLEAERRDRQEPSRRPPPIRDGYVATDFDAIFNSSYYSVDEGYIGDDDLHESIDFSDYARDNSYVDLNLQPLADFVTNFGTTFKPIPPPPRTIINVAMHLQTPLPTDLPASLLVGRTVGKWVATESLDDLSSPVLLFWPKKHRVRLLGFGAAFQLLQNAFHAPHNALPLGYASLSELATAVMEMLGDSDVKTTDADREAMTAFVSASRSALLRSLYVTHCIDVFDDTKRSDGVAWLKTTCVEFGWEDVGAAIVQLVDQSLGDWHKTHAYAYLDWANLAAALRFVMALLDALTELNQPYFPELVVTLWHTVVANAVRFRDEDESYVGSSDDQRTCALHIMLQLEVRVACDWDASPTSSWFGSRLPSLLVAAICSYVTPVGSVVSIVQRCPVAMAPLLTLLPGISAMDGTRPTPLLPLVQDELEAQYDLAQEDDSTLLAERLEELHRWIGLEKDLVATFAASWKLCYETTACALLRALHQGLALSPTDATAIVNLILGFTASLVGNRHSFDWMDDKIVAHKKAQTVTHALLLILDRLSPSHVPLFVADLIEKVGRAPVYMHLDCTRTVLYPMIRYLDDKLPANYAPSRQALVAASSADARIGG